MRRKKCDNRLYHITGSSLLTVLHFLKGQYNKDHQELDSHLDICQEKPFNALQGVKSNSTPSDTEILITVSYSYINLKQRNFNLNLIFLQRNRTYKNIYFQ